MCGECGAMMWLDEKSPEKFDNGVPIYKMCCGGGKVRLPAIKPPPEPLRRLYSGTDADSKCFLENIRKFNNNFSFTSFSANETHIAGRAPSMFKIQGTTYHRIGSLLPEDGCDPAFTSMYIYDVNNQIENRAAYSVDSPRGTTILNILQVCLNIFTI